MCVLLFWLLRGPPPSFQINHTWGLILSYECPALAWLVSCQLFLLKLFQLPFTSGLSSFPIFVHFSFLLTPWVAAPHVLLSLFSLYSVCLTAPPILACTSLLAVRLLIRTIRSFRQAKNQNSTVNQMHCKQSHTTESNNPLQEMVKKSRKGRLLCSEENETQGFQSAWWRTNL